MLSILNLHYGSKGLKLEIIVIIKTNLLCHNSCLIQLLIRLIYNKVFHVAHLGMVEIGQELSWVSLKEIHCKCLAEKSCVLGMSSLSIFSYVSMMLLQCWVDH